MNIDWFTFTAQIVNFGILVWLLKRFLYAPILKAMDDRESDIANQLQQSIDAKQNAERAQRDYKSKLAALSDANNQMQADAQRDVESWRNEHLQAAKQDIDAARADWQKALGRDRDSLLTEIQLDAARHATQMGRHLVRELASADLQTLMVDRFLNELAAADSSLFEGCDSRPIVVESALELEAADAEHLRDGIQSVAPNCDVEFRINTDIVCGIELQLLNTRVAWSVRECMAELESDLIDMIDRSIPTAESHGKTPLKHAKVAAT